MKPDPKTQKALALARARAKHVLEHRDARLARRSRSLKAVHDVEPAPTAIRGAKRALLARRAGGPASRGTLVAEGDSWFDYPFTDVLKCLEDLHGYDVDSVAHRGDRVEDMAYSDGQLDDFVRTIERNLRRGIDPPKAILLSGGGNDIAGDEFAMLLNHWRSPRKGLSESILRGVIDERLRDSYLTILATVTEVCRARLGAKIPILVHGYDYAVPDGRGFWGGWGPLPGPWLEPGFEMKAVPGFERQSTVNALIDRFNTMLDGVVRTNGLEHVRYVDLRGDLPNGAGYRQWWANELHPTERGYAKVAGRFAAVLEGT